VGLKRIGGGGGGMLDNLGDGHDDISKTLVGLDVNCNFTLSHSL
jgi:hypothetical protein